MTAPNTKPDEPLRNRVWKLIHPHITAEPNYDSGMELLDKLETFIQAETEKAVQAELQYMKAGFTQALQGKPAEFKYIMQPIIRAVDARLATLEEKQ